MKFLSFIFAFLMAFNYCLAQDLRFTYSVAHSGNTSSVIVSVYNLLPTAENLSGFTINMYYDNTESSLTGFDTSPTTTLGWSNNQSSTLHVINSNPAIGSTHTGFGTINVIDEAIVGTNVGTTPVEILSVNFDNTPGTSAPSIFYTASTAENHPALNYVGSDFVGHPVIVQPNTSFPVAFLGFEVKPLENRASLLSWETATELNNKGFFVERAYGENFSDQWKDLGFVGGKGTVNEVSEYQFIDQMPLAGENLYRLRQVDFDGTFSYSRTRSVLFEASANIQVYPNPTTAIVNVRFEDQSEGNDVDYQLFDKAGRLLQQGSLKVFELNQIDLNPVPEGSYILRIDQNGRISKENIVKIN